MQEELVEIIWEDILKTFKGKNQYRRPTDLWIQRFHAFKCFVAQHKRYPLHSENKELSSWVSQQKSTNKTGKISQICVEILNDYGFVWESCIEQQWNTKYENVKRYLKKHKTFPYKSTNTVLACWLIRQRRAKNNGTLSKEREEKLDTIGFLWTEQDILLSGWFKVFRRYKAFVEKHGDFPTCRTSSTLSAWASSVRYKKKQGELSKQQLEALDSINFMWDVLQIVIDKNWETKYEELETYIKIHGTYPERSNKSSKLLRIWYYKQTAKLKNGELSIDQEKRLEKLNWITAVNLLWETKYNLFMAFIEKHKIYPTPVTDKSICNWVSTQRILKKQNKLNHDREAKLEAIGFIWNAVDTVWDNTCDRLIQWINTHKRPPKHTTERCAKRWYVEQKKRKKAGLLSKRKEQKLDKVIQLEKELSKELQNL